MSEANLPPENQLGNEEDQDNEGLALDASSKEAENENTDLKDDDSGKDDSNLEKSDETETKKPTGIQRRFQKFEARLNEQAQELEYWKKQAMGTKPAPQEERAEKPKLADFESIEEYVEARENFLREELLAEVDQRTVQKTNQSQVQSTYAAKVKEVQKELLDWEDVMEGASDEQASPETVHFCMDSEIGPRIAYELAKNPDLNDRLNSMSPMRRVAELGKLEDKLLGVKPVQKKITNAPGKITEVKGNAAISAPSADTAQSYAEWKKADNARKKAAK